jgi:hypothetical protein
VYYQNVASGIDAKKMTLDTAGNLLVIGGVTMYGTSDQRLKQNIRTFKASEELMKLGGVYQFEYVEDRVTAKKAVNLRSLPSTEDPRCEIVAQLDNGVVIRRTGINRDLGWSRVDYNGRPLYCITSYLKVVN